MMEWIAAAALRSLIVAGVVRVGIALLRITHPLQEKAIWTTLLVGALAMPALVRWTFMPTLPVLSFTVPMVTLHGLRAGGYFPPAATGVITGGVAALYVGVSLVLMSRMAVGGWRMWQIRARAIPVREPWTLGLDVRSARQLSNPATFGASILLPPAYVSWTQTKLTIIMRHEQTHVRHRDGLVQWLAGLHVCLFWFSPLSWWLRRRLAHLAEYASDDEVLRLNIPKVDYATVLFEEAEMGAAGSLLVSIASRDLERRIDRILSANQPGRSPSRARRALAVSSVIPIIALASEGVGQQLPGPPPAPLPDPPQAPLSAAAPGNDPVGSSRDSPPFIIGGPEDLRKYYPPEAQRQSVDGMVQITVTLDEAGRATDTRILSEEPTGMGFGAAASELAHQFKYAKPTSQPASVTFRIKFALDDHPGRQTGPA